MLKGGIVMSLIDLYPSMYCPYIANIRGEEQMFLQRDINPNSNLYRLDLFENKETMYAWLKKEEEIQAQKEQWSMQAIYKRLYPKKIFLQELIKLMEDRKEIDSITFVGKDGLRRLYFRYELENNYRYLLEPNQKLYLKEPIYIINRQRKLDEQVILQKESYFVVYPVIATALFSLDIREWAEDLISRKPNQGYYIEETTLYDTYNRANLNLNDTSLYILTRGSPPHYILRQSDLKKMAEA